jgi:hypothetical protein
VRTLAWISHNHRLARDFERYAQFAAAFFGGESTQSAQPSTRAHIKPRMGEIVVVDDSVTVLFGRTDVLIQGIRRAVAHSVQVTRLRGDP